MAILAASLKWYHPTTKAEGDSHGGAINTADEVTDDTANNVWDDVSDAERISGDTEYRKVFFRNENAGAYNSVKIWIQTQTPATNDAVSVVLGGSKSTASTPVALTGTLTFEAGTAVTGSGTAFLTEVAIGELIYNTQDAEGDAKAIASIESDTALTLGAAYAGTTGSGKTANVAGADQCTFVSPDSKAHGDVLSPGNLVQNASVGVWVKRVVDVAGDGYSNNSYVLKAENS